MRMSAGPAAFGALGLGLLGLLGLLAWLVSWLADGGPRVPPATPSTPVRERQASPSSSLPRNDRAAPSDRSPERERLEPLGVRADSPSRAARLPVTPRTDWMTPVARSFLSDRPDLAGMGEILRQLALRAVIDEARLEHRGRLVRAPVTLPDSDLTGRLTLLNNFASVELATPRGQPLIGGFVRRTVQMQFIFGPSGPILPRVTVQYAPPSRAPEERELWERFIATAGDEVQRTGANVFLAAAGGPRMTPLTCQIKRAWGKPRISLGSVDARPVAGDKAAATAPPDLTAFDLWYERLQSYREKPGNATPTGG